MQDNIEDWAKQRLTDKGELREAIEFLQSRGYDIEAMLAELVRLFYVDLDEFRDLVNAA